MQLACSLHFVPTTTDELKNSETHETVALIIKSLATAEPHKPQSTQTGQLTNPQGTGREQETNKQSSETLRRAEEKFASRKSSAAVGNTISDSSLQPVTRGRDGGMERKGGRKRGGER